jgi:hypothetical protein
MKTKLHSYHFNLKYLPDHQAYILLKERMKRESRRDNHIKFVDTAPRDNQSFDFLKPIICDGNLTTYEVELDIKHVFNNQWNSADTLDHSGYRVFDWVEYYNPHNVSLIRGHWLEVTDEMIAIRENTLKCGYCGAQYGPHHQASEHPDFCTKCLDSPYLKEEDLGLLRLYPVSAKHGPQSSELSSDDRAWLLPRYTEAQMKGNKDRAESRALKQREALEEKRALNDMEYAGFDQLLNAGIDIRNIIFHSHIPVFKFGWRSALSPSVAEAMKAKIEEIGFKFPTEFAIA